MKLADLDLHCFQKNFEIVIRLNTKAEHSAVSVWHCISQKY